MGAVGASVLLLDAGWFEELEPVDLVLIAVLREPRLRTDVQVEMLSWIALGPSDSSVLRPGAVTSPEAYV